MKLIFVFIALISGCAVAREYPDNPYQKQAFVLIDRYNTDHGIEIPYPVVLIGFTQPLDEGETHCSSSGICTVSLNESLGDRHEPGYTMKVTLPHEVAHAICIYLKRCGQNDHGEAWKQIARELGVPESDFYLRQ